MPEPFTESDIAFLQQAVKACLTLLQVSDGDKLAEGVGFTRTKEDVETFWQEFIAHVQKHGEIKIDDMGLVDEIVRLAWTMNAEGVMEVPGARQAARNFKALLTKIEGYTQDPA